MLTQDSLDPREIRQGWRALAACRGLDPELFFADGEGDDDAGRIAEAKAVCESCPVRVDCLEHALAAREPHGIWGGATEAERRRLLRRRRERRRRSPDRAA